MLILFTTCISWAWYSYVLNISERYLFQNPDFEVHKFMPILQVVLVSLFFIVHFVLALIDFLNRYWYWGLWLVVVPIIVGQVYFSVFGLVAHIDHLSVWVDYPFCLLMLIQICTASFVRRRYLKPAP
ncbi:MULTISPECIES: hypothetical protein [unclassified Acinetobacter]|uniref:hypothetical protein n=1 Tax=unclassified Acinetobacter TaxID=196816 RepID=UPI0015D18B26|nr:MULTISPECIES: hypothetical protein [unclassified Acinetobacter]